MRTRWSLLQTSKGFDDGLVMTYSAEPTVSLQLGLFYGLSRNKLMYSLFTHTVFRSSFPILKTDLWSLRFFFFFFTLTPGLMQPWQQQQLGVSNAAKTWSSRWHLIFVILVIVDRKCSGKYFFFFLQNAFDESGKVWKCLWGETEKKKFKLKL